MIKHRFYLRKDIKTKDGLFLVFSDMSYNGIRLRIPVPNVKIKEKHWLPDDQRVRRPGKGEPYNYFEEFSIKLENVETLVSEIRKTVLLNNKSLSNEYILEPLRNPNKIKTDRRDFFATTDEYILISKSIRAKNTVKSPEQRYYSFLPLT